MTIEAAIALYESGYAVICNDGAVSKIEYERQE